MNAAELVAAVMPHFAPPPELTVSQWAAEHRRLPVSSPSRGARWANESAPYLAEVMDSACSDQVRRLVIMGAIQTGKSESIRNALAYWIEHDPSNVLWVMPSYKDAEKFSRGPLNDMIRSTPVLAKVVRGRRAPRGANEAESTVLEKMYSGYSLILAGSGTPNSFAGVSARRVVADEFERFDDLDEGAADVLLMNRTAAFYDSLAVFISTPLLKGGKIDAQFQTTDQRRYHLTCPGCGHETWTAWSETSLFHVTYEDKDPESARLACPWCPAKHDEVARRRMVAGGRWRPTAEPVDPGARGYHLPAMVSTLGDVTLPRLVQKWLAARASGPAGLMSFVNTILAEPWEDRGGRVEPGAIMARLEDYGKDVDVPAGAVCLTAGVDVQIDRFEVQVIGWGLGGESWVIDCREIPGDPTNAEVQAALLVALDERFRHESGHLLPIITACVDSGYLPDKVAYALALRRPRRILAVKGIGGRFGESSILKFKVGEPPATLNVDGLKLEVALGLEMAAPGPGYMHLNRAICDEAYIAQLCAEHRETKRRNGVSTMVWVEDSSQNHALDTAVYARAGLKLLTRMTGSRNEYLMLARMAEQIATTPVEDTPGGLVPTTPVALAPKAQVRPPRTQSWKRPQ